MKVKIISAFIIIFLVAVSVYQIVITPEVTLQSQSVFSQEEDTYISVSFRIDENYLKNVKLDEVNINNLENFSYYVLPYDNKDYTNIIFEDKIEFSSEIKENQTYTVIIGPVTRASLNEDTEVTFNFNNFNYSFNWIES